MLTLVPVIRPPAWERTAVAPIPPALVVLLIVPSFSLITPTVLAGTKAPAAKRLMLPTFSVKEVPTGAVIVPPGALSATQFVQVIVSPAGTVTDCPGPAVICAAAGGAAIVANSGTIRTAQTAQAARPVKRLWSERRPSVLLRRSVERVNIPRSAPRPPRGHAPRCTTERQGMKPSQVCSAFPTSRALRCARHTRGAFLPSLPPPSAIARMRGSSRSASSLLAFMLAPSPALRATCKKASSTSPFATFETRVQPKAVLVDLTVTPNHAGAWSSIFAARCRFATDGALHLDRL